MSLLAAALLTWLIVIPLAVVCCFYWLSKLGQRREARTDSYQRSLHL